MLIFLIGFMGAGKSYIARNLSPILKYDFIDMDKHIEENEGMSISQIFELKGEHYFRQLEHNFLIQLNPNQNLIISTGGGVPCFYNNMDIMNEKGLTIYLNRSKKIVLERLLKGQQKRPLIQGMTLIELEKFYDERLALREIYYKQSKLEVDDKIPEEIAELISSL